MEANLDSDDTQQVDTTYGGCDISELPAKPIEGSLSKRGLDRWKIR